MAERILNTKIALLYKTYAQWDELKNTYVPLKGEVCLCEVPASTGVSQTEPCVLFKVGDGTKTFAALPWASALAADVYAWAKKANLEWVDFTDSLKQSIKEYVGGDEQNTLYQIVADGTNKWKLQKSDDKGVTWTDATGVIDLSTTIANINANIAKKVDRTIVGANGTAEIFNEQDGGGAKFTHNDGSEAFVGVNDGGKDGLMAQIYADKLVDGKWQGAKLDVTNGAIYYTVGNKSFAARAVSDNELVVKKDIKDLAGGMHFIGATTLQAGESIEQAIARIYAAKGKSYADKKAGDIVIIKTSDSDKEFIYDGTSWVELGDQGVYATKAELASEASSRSDADATLQSNIDAEAVTRAAEDAKKVDKEIISAEGKALIFNESDGGGAKFENVSGIDSFVGVHNGGEDESGIAAQIYAIDNNIAGKLGAKLDITQGGMYYTRGAASGSRPSSRDVPDNELAVQRDISDAVRTEKNRAEAAEAALQSGKLDVMPGDEHTAGNAYNLPYYFYTVPSADKVEVHTKTVSLDGQKTYGDYSLDVAAATQTTAGLMNATDKAKLDHFYAKDLTQETGDVLILNCNY